MVPRRKETDADTMYQHIMDKVQIISYTSDTDMSVGEAISRVTSTMGLTADEKLFQQYEQHTSLEHEYGGDISNLSLWWYNEGKEFEG